MDKKIRRVTNHCEILQDEKAVLMENMDKAINSIVSCLEYVKEFPSHVTEKDLDTLLEYEMKMVMRFSEINLSFIDFSNNNPPPSINIPRNEPTIPPKEQNTLTSKNQYVNSNFDLQSKISSEVTVENTCSGLNSSSPLVSTDSSNRTSVPPEASIDTNTVETDADDVSYIATFSSLYQHPLSELKLQVEHLPKEYDKEDIDTIKEDLKQLSTKLGVNQTSLAEVNQYISKTLPSLNYEYLTPEKDTPKPIRDFKTPKENVAYTAEDESSESTETEIANAIIICSDKKEPLPNNTEVPLNNSNLAPAKSINVQSSTGAIKKIKSSNLIEFSTSDSESENVIKNSAIEKLSRIQIVDKRLQAQIDAKQKLPDIKLLPVIRPAVIKNNLDSGGNMPKRKKKSKNDKNCNEKSVLYELKVRDVPPAGTLCAFSHIETPDEFYIHIADEESVMADTISEQIKADVIGTSSEYNTKEEAFSKIGKYCFAFILSYKAWYRVQVLDWYLGSDSTEVWTQLVDYGNKCFVNYKNLRKITRELAKIPMLAMKCHLPLVYPPGSTLTEKLTDWPDSAIDALAGISGLFHQEEIHCKLFKIVYAEKEGDSVAIDLCNLEDQSEENTVGQILLDLGQAIQIIDDYGDENAELAEFLEDIDELERPDNINEALIGYDARDEIRICRFTRPDGSCFKGKHCKLEHLPLPKDGYTTDKILVFRQAINSLLMPKKGDIVTVLVTGYTDACTFLAQFVTTPGPQKGYSMDRDLFRQLEAMNNKKVVRSYKPMKVWPAIGEVVIVKHWTKKWLRGIVRELIRGNQQDEVTMAQVYMVDFGDTVDVSLTEIRQMNEEYMQLPFQIVQIYLHNFQQKATCDPKEAEKFFQRHISYHNFLAHVKSNSDPFSVKLTTYNGNDVGQTLQQKGFAEPRTSDCHISDDAILEL